MVPKPTHKKMVVGLPGFYKYTQPAVTLAKHGGWKTGFLFRWLPASIIFVSGRDVFFEGVFHSMIQSTGYTWVSIGVLPPTNSHLTARIITFLYISSRESLGTFTFHRISCSFHGTTGAPFQKWMMTPSVMAPSRCK